MSEPSFSFDDFRKWMSTSTFRGSKKDKLVGMHVESKLNVKNLLDKMTAETEDMKEMAKEFRRDGGSVLCVFKDDMVLIEVNSGKFTIHKYFLKKEDNYYD